MRNLAFSLLHAEHGSHGSLADLLSQKLGRFGEFIDEVIFHGFIDTLKLVLFLFLTYLLMEFIEHKASDKLKSLVTSGGRFGPALGGLFGAVPQCGFSAAAANLYTGRVITLGTLVAVFLSTSDEMLPILLAGNMKIGTVLLIILYKTVVGILVGFVIDFAMKLMRRGEEEINIDEICDADDCHCERGILPSALHHTVSVSLFIFIVTVCVNALLFFVGDEALSGSLLSLPVVSHILAGLVGLIPNCASSVALTRLAMSGVIPTGAMMSGLFAGAGVGLLILFRMNRRPKENITITVLLLIVGVLFGLLADLIGLSLV
jgi:hypothetical protein